MISPTKIIFIALADALATAIYATLVGLFMFNAEKLLGPMNNPLGIAGFLMLFMLSATICGVFVLGRPIHYYLTNREKQAFSLLGFTIGWLSVFTLLAILVSRL